MARVYALANQKGGVGKTTTAINLAACLAEAGERALVIDLDPQANATSGLGMRANGTSSYDLLDGAPLADLAKHTAFANLDLIPSRPDLAGAVVELAAREDGERYLAQALASGTSQYDFVFIDCPPALGPLTVNALAAADRVLVPVQAEYYALEGLTQLMQSIDLIRRRLNPGLGIGGVLMTMVDRVPVSRRTSRRRCASISARSSSATPSRARCDWPKRRATVCLQSHTTAVPRERRRTGRWRWNLSSAANRRGLGRGLELLMGGVEPAATELLELPVDAVHPNPRQPRKRFDGEAGSGLAESIRTQGVIQPLLVRPRTAGGYEIVAGERRWRAAREAGRQTVPAVVRESDDRETLLLGLVENVAREQLTAVEEARAYAVLIDEFGLSLGDVAERVGRSKPSVSNRIRLLELPDDVLGMVERGQISEGHARAVLAVPDHEGRRRLAREIVQKGLSVRVAEQRAKWAGAKQKPRVRATPVDPALAARVREGLQRITGFHAKVTSNRIEIVFADEHELAEIAEALERM